MDLPYVSALSALAGSVIGSVTSTSMTWLTQRVQTRSRQLAHEFARREELYRDFIIAASKTYGDALVTSEPNHPKLITLCSLISRMRVLSVPRTIASADRLMLTSIDAYFTLNRSLRELRGLIKAWAGIDPLKDFSEAAREEVATFKFVT
jgi:hypothetical protein